MKRARLFTIFICLFFISAFLAFFSVSAENIQVFFSPQGGCQASVISEIDKAQGTIDIAMYFFTSRQAAQSLLRAKERGVTIRVVLDKSQKEEFYSKARYLSNKGIPVRYYEGRGLMHNKFAIVDKKILITGSFNWTATAEKQNEENLLILTDNRVVEKYLGRFEYLWHRSRAETKNPWSWLIRTK
jgi:phosphatidylserine/phosphatidylglycerophosphate/cardiolipin synthase-like enzyme